MRHAPPRAIAVVDVIATMISFPSGAAAQTAQTAERDARWLYREVSGEGPMAVFMDWHYESVVFRVTCDDRDLIVRYGLKEAEVPTTRMALLIDGAPIELRTAVTADGALGALEGRVRATPQLFNAVTVADDIDIDAPNEMGEPWYLGRTEPLRRVLHACAGF